MRKSRLESALVSWRRCARELSRAEGRIESAQRLSDRQSRLELLEAAEDDARVCVGLLSRLLEETQAAAHELRDELAGGVDE